MVKRGRKKLKKSQLLSYIMTIRCNVSLVRGLERHSEIDTSKYIRNLLTEHVKEMDNKEKHA